MNKLMRTTSCVVLAAAATTLFLAPAAIAQDAIKLAVPTFLTGAGAPAFGVPGRNGAEMAIQAALTGHLVLSTIHTNSAWATISRLIDMGIPPFLIASTLNISIAQRLVRQLCNHCKK